ncbi:hypothetical protein [Lysobacter hankyongensis]|uniref:Uncharacterized protein n=1 Tax=Lysobacter hankyongensis TaxID=1176535 RepID=A0ABP9BN29_9GAMM
MFNRSSLKFVFALSIALVAATASAHDPRFHEPEYQAPPAKLKPTTCAQLADTQRYSNDMTDPDIKALKAKCDATAKAAKAEAKKSR